MDTSITLPQEQLFEIYKKAEGVSYALQTIFKRAMQKVSSSSTNSFYGADYNDCHGDYYDSEYD